MERYTRLHWKSGDDHITRQRYNDKSCKLGVFPLNRGRAIRSKLLVGWKFVMMSSCNDGAASASKRMGMQVKIVWAQVITRLCARWILENNRRAVLSSHGFWALPASSTVMCIGTSPERLSISSVHLMLVEIMSTQRKGQDRAASRQR